MKWLCSFKAYGDLVIACNFMRDVDSTEYGLLLGSHLVQLLEALGFAGRCAVLDVGAEVPAIFDIRKRGFINAVRSGVGLRRAIRSVALNTDDKIVFDKLGIRQRFISWPTAVEQIRCGAPNIYLDYHCYFGSSVKNTPTRKYIEKVVIFPDSRISEKSIPDKLVASLCMENEARGIQTLIVKIGQPSPVPGLAQYPVKWLDGFSLLLDQIAGADAIVSADSLPAHIAEYLGLPVFVFNSIPNEYWMPLSVHLNGWSSMFSDLSRYQQWLSVNEIPKR